MNPEDKRRGYTIGGLGFWQKGNIPPSDGTKVEDCIVIGGYGGNMFTMVINKNTGKIAGAIAD